MVAPRMRWGEILTSQRPSTFTTEVHYKCEFSEFFVFLMCAWSLVRRRQYWARTDRTTCSASAWREFSQVSSRSLLLLQ